jgi:hypothetical protein
MLRQLEPSQCLLRRAFVRLHGPHETSFVARVARKRLTETRVVSRFSSKRVYHRAELLGPGIPGLSGIGPFDNWIRASVKKKMAMSRNTASAAVGLRAGARDLFILWHDKNAMSGMS